MTNKKQISKSETTNMFSLVFVFKYFGEVFRNCDFAATDFMIQDIFGLVYHGFPTWWLIPLSEWINLTYPIYNWGYNPLTKWDEPPSTSQAWNPLKPGYTSAYAFPKNMI